MSQRGLHFANDWISDAIDALVAGTGQAVIIEQWAAQLLADAAAEGISRGEIEKGVGDLADYIAGCLVEAARRANGQE